MGNIVEGVIELLNLEIATAVGHEGTGMKLEISDYMPNSGYNYKATLKFFVDDEYVADIKGGEHIGWTSGDLYCDDLEEMVDTLKFNQR